MTDIERMAREAGIQAVENVLFRRGRDQDMTEPEKAQWAAVERFAALVQAAERERNAALCEGARSVAEHSSRDGHKRSGAIAMASTCAMLIRGG